MTTNLDILRRQAKQLRRAFLAGDGDARRRVDAVLGDRTPFKHADALQVIAQEAGHDSWPKLKAAYEIADMTRADRIKRLQIALYYGQHWVTDTLLKTEPDLPAYDFGLQIALYECDAVLAAIGREPGAATRPWAGRAPLLHLTFSKHIHAAPERADDMIAIANALAEAGADINAGVPAEPGSDHLLSPLYGALGHADNMRLAAWLLERGANPNDNESLYHATELGHHDGLKLLLAHGASPDGTNALARALDFDDTDAVALLLQAGANTNEDTAPHPSGQPVQAIPALHQAARRMCSRKTAELLIAHGAQGGTRYNGHTAYAFARMFGNRAVASVLEHTETALSLTAEEQIIADAADGRVTGQLSQSLLTDEMRRMMCRVAAFGDRLEHIQTLHAIGIDPDWTEEMGMPAVHIAGWEGHPDLVVWLLGLEPDLTHRNDYGGDLIGTIIHGAEFCPKRAERDHVACARHALSAGCRVQRSEIELCGVEEMTSLLNDWVEAHPDCLV